MNLQEELLMNLEIIILNHLTFCKESLNDKGNNGIYLENQKTSSGVTPSEDLMVYKISPGKAYVRGYEVETISPAFLDIPKTRTTNLIQNQAVNFSFGSTLTLNRSSGLLLLESIHHQQLV
jgi:hypothetical protein